MTINDGDDQGQPEEPYTISQLLADYGVTSGDDAEPEIPAASGKETDASHRKCSYIANKWPAPGSLTPGDDTNPERYAAYARANIVFIDTTTQSLRQCIASADTIATTAHVAILIAQIRKTNHIAQHLPCNTPTEIARTLYEQTNQSTETAVSVLEQARQKHTLVDEVYNYIVEPLTQTGYLPDANHPNEECASGVATAIRAHAIAAQAAAQVLGQAFNDDEDPAARLGYQHVIFDLYHSIGSEPELTKLPKNHEVQRALHELSTTFHLHRTRFNANLTTTFSPSIQGTLRKILTDATDIEVDSVGHHMAAIGNNFSFLPMTIFYYQGAKHCQAIYDHYPKEFPARIAERHYKSVLNAFSRPPLGPRIDVQTQAIERIHLAQIDCHTLDPKNVQAFTRVLHETKLPLGAVYPVFAAATGADMLTTSALIHMADLPFPIVTPEQAQAVIESARAAGIDEVQIAIIANSMACTNHQELGIRTPKLDQLQIDLIQHAAVQAGFPTNLAEMMANAINNLNGQ